MSNRCALLVLVSLSVLATSSRGADLWPQFRGPDGNGIANVSHSPTHWGNENNIVWKTDLPGRGWSSPVVADGQVYLTSAIERIPTEQERLDALEKLGENPKFYKQRHVASSVVLQLLQVDLASGKLTQRTELLRLDTPAAIHTVNSYSSPTPVIDADRIYCHFGTFGTVCLDRKTGQRKWERQLPLQHSVGPGSSPFIYKDLLVLICDGVDRQYVTALNKTTGQQVWITERPEMEAPSGEQKKSFDTPIAVTDSKGREQLICMGSQWLVSYAPETGNELWKVYHGKGFSVVPRPVYANDVVYISTGYGKPQLWAIRVDGSGDVTDTHVQWVVNKGIPAKPSPLLIGDEIFVVSDDGIATCFSIEDGSPHWKERLGGKYSASPLLADQKIYFCSEDGKTSVISHGTTFELIAENQLEGHFMASPIAVDNSLLLRSQTALYRIADADAK